MDQSAPKNSELRPQRVLSPCQISTARCLHHIPTFNPCSAIPIFGSHLMPIIACGPGERSALFTSYRPRPGCISISRGGGPAGFSAPQVTTDICHSANGEVSPNPKKSQQNRNLGKSFLSAQTTSALRRKPVWV